MVEMSQNVLIENLAVMCICTHTKSSADYTHCLSALIIHAVVHIVVFNPFSTIACVCLMGITILLLSQYSNTSTCLYYGRASAT